MTYQSKALRNEEFRPRIDAAMRQEAQRWGAVVPSMTVLDAALAALEARGFSLMDSGNVSRMFSEVQKLTTKFAQLVSERRRSLDRRGAVAKINVEPSWKPDGTPVYYLRSSAPFDVALSGSDEMRHVEPGEQLEVEHARRSPLLAPPTPKLRMEPTWKDGEPTWRVSTTAPVLVEFATGRTVALTTDDWLVLEPLHVVR